MICDIWVEYNCWTHELTAGPGVRTWPESEDATVQLQNRKECVVVLPLFDRTIGYL